MQKMGNFGPAMLLVPLGLAAWILALIHEATIKLAAQLELRLTSPA